MPIEWTAERLQTLNKKQLETLRQNAEKIGDNAVVELCNATLASLRPSKSSLSANATDKGPVIGYHLVCRPEERGVERNPDGTVWSGTWVIAENEAKRSRELGAYVALHASQSEPSYLHGIIKEYRRSKRDSEYAERRQVKIDTGTDFLLAPTNKSVEWSGPGTVERSYVRAVKPESNE